MTGKHLSDSKIAKTLAPHSFLDKALFVFGAGRSGTTLLHSLMDSHAEVVVWPFEFLYYSEFEKLRKDNHFSNNGKIPLNLLNKHFLNRPDIQAFGGTLPYSLGISLDLQKVDKDKFLKFMTSFPEEEAVSRCDYLKLLILAYHHSFNPEQKPDFFLVDIQGIRDEVIADFPDAGFLWAYREPIDNYIAIKKDYFTSFDNRFFCYFPKVYIPAFRYGLLETALWPILYTENWVNTNRDKIKLKRVDLKDIQNNPIETMKNVSDYFGLTFSDTMLETTFAGIRFDSNLSSARKSGGKILKTKRYNPQKHLTSYEYHFVCKKMKIRKRRALKGIKAFFKLLKNEFPDKVLTSNRNIPYGIRFLMTIFSFAAVYLNNRFFFLFYRFRSDNPWE